MRNIVCEKKLSSFLLCLCLFLSVQCRSLPEQHTRPTSIESLQARLRELEIIYSIEELRHLRKLDLMGSLVQDSDLLLVDTLPFLEELNISSTNISNQGLRYLKKARHRLRFLYFRGCKNKGGLSALRAFLKLQTLDLSFCDLAGQSLSHLQELPLRALFLGHSSFSNTHQLSAFRSLQKLSLDGLDLDFQDLEVLQRLPLLEHLTLNEAVLPGRFFSVLARYPHLTSLELRSLETSSLGQWQDIPKMQAGFNRLQAIDLSENSNLPHSLPRLLLHLPRLKTLFLADSNLTRKAFQNLQFAGLCRLQKISFSGIPLRDADLGFLRACQKIEMLDLSRTQLKGDFLQILSLKKLRFLDLSSTPILASRLSYLQASPGLRSLFLNNTAIGPKGVLHLHSLKFLEVLELNQSKSGRSVIVLPEVLPKLKSLSILDNGLDPIEADQLAKKYKKISIEF